MKITWDTDVNAPGCPGQIVADDGRSVLIQTDWDYPGTASSFGWVIGDVAEDDDISPRCDHPGTDGTVDCPRCGLAVDVFLTAAADWLQDHDGVTAEDPGYFTEEE